MCSSSSSSNLPRVCIIGAGAAGLVSAKVFLNSRRIGEVMVFEQFGGVGGLWRHSYIREKQRKKGCKKSDYDFENNNNRNNDNKDQKYEEDIAADSNSIRKNSSFNNFSPSSVPSSSSAVSSTLLCRCLQCSSWQSPMYESLRTNIPKEVMAFSDFPFDESLPSYIRQPDILRYLENYAELHNIIPFITFHCAVRTVIPPKKKRETESDPFSNIVHNDRKMSIISINNDHITVGQHQSEEDRRTEKEDYMWLVNDQPFDFVIVATGKYGVPNYPSPLLHSVDFEGIVMHSQQYETPEIFRGKSVLVVGGHASGTDLSYEISSTAKMIIWKIGENRNSTKKKFFKVPANVRISSRVKFVEASGNLIFEGNHENINEEEEEEEEGEKKIEGEKWKVDAIVYATGYKVNFPFLSQTVLHPSSCSDDLSASQKTAENNNNTLSSSSFSSVSSSSSYSGSRNIDDDQYTRLRDDLVLYLFHRDYPTSLFFIGLPYMVAPFPVAEYQAEAALSLALKDMSWEIVKSRELKFPQQMQMRQFGYLQIMRFIGKSNTKEFLRFCDHLQTQQKQQTDEMITPANVVMLEECIRVLSDLYITNKIAQDADPMRFRNRNYHMMMTEEKGEEKEEKADKRMEEKEDQRILTKTTTVAAAAASKTQNERRSAKHEERRRTNEIFQRFYVTYDGEDDEFWKLPKYDLEEYYRTGILREREGNI